MTLLPFDLQKALAGHPVVRGDGTDIIELAYIKKAENGYRVIALLSKAFGPNCYFDDGTAHGYIEGSKQCLFLLAPEPKKVKGWVNVYPLSTLSQIYFNKETADISSRDDRISCIPIEFTEGEGLEEGK